MWGSRRILQAPRGLEGYLGSCQNYGPFLGTLNNRCRIIKGTPKRDHNFDNHPFGTSSSSIKA